MLIDWAGADPTTMSVPQLEIQPFWPGADVPGAPVDDCEMVQKSLLIPHWPYLFYMGDRLAVAKRKLGRGTHTQQALRGQGFRLASVIPGPGWVLPGFCGPQMALVIGAGIGGAPVLRQMFWKACKFEHPCQAQVWVLKLSISALVRLLAAPKAEQLSPATT
jgi:hypothetical protein